MNEINNNQNTHGINELERVFQAYKQKLTSAEKEADEITKCAWEKAEKLIADKQEEAQQIAYDINRKAQLEADRIIREAENKAVEIERKATDQAKKEAKERTKRETENIIADTKKMAEKEAAEIVDSAKKESEAIIKKGQEAARLQIFKEAEAIITEAKQKAAKAHEDSIDRAEDTYRLINEALKKTYGIMTRIMEQVQKDLNDVATTFGKEKDEIELKSILAQSELSANDTETAAINMFQGLSELNIMSPYDTKQIKKLLDGLKQIPSIKLEAQAGTEEDYSIYLNIAQPIPLQNILQEMSIVDRSDVQGNKIKIHFKYLGD